MFSIFLIKGHVDVALFTMSDALSLSYYTPPPPNHVEYQNYNRFKRLLHGVFPISAYDVNCNLRIRSFQVCGECDDFILPTGNVQRVSIVYIGKFEEDIDGVDGTECIDSYMRDDRDRIHPGDEYVHRNAHH